MNPQVKYMLSTYEFFIIHSLIIIFIIQPSPSNKKSAYTNLLQSYFEVIFCEKIVVRMKNVKFRGEKTNSVSQFRGPIPRSNPKFRASPRNSAGRGKLWALQISNPLRCIYIYIYKYRERRAIVEAPHPRPRDAKGATIHPRPG